MLCSAPENDIFRIVKNRIALNLSFFAEGLFDFFINVFGWILHKYGWIGVTFGHFFLTLNQTTDHTMRDNNRLLWQLISIFSSQHVHSSLIDTKLADINIQKEYIIALHARIEKLRYFQLIWLFAAHDGGTFLNPRNCVFACNVHHIQPILSWAFVYFFRGPKELDIWHLHSSSFPNFNEIPTNSSYFFQITIKLAIQHSKVISNPKNENSSSINHFIDVYGTEQSLSNVHSARRLKAIVTSEKLLFFESSSNVFLTNDFWPNTFYQTDSFFDC